MTRYENINKARHIEQQLGMDSETPDKVMIVQQKIRNSHSRATRAIQYILAVALGAGIVLLWLNRTGVFTDSWVFSLTVSFGVVAICLCLRSRMIVTTFEIKFYEDCFWLVEDKKYFGREPTKRIYSQYQYSDMPFCERTGVKRIYIQGEHKEYVYRYENGILATEAVLQKTTARKKVFFLLTSSWDFHSEFYKYLPLDYVSRKESSVNSDFVRRGNTAISTSAVGQRNIQLLKRILIACVGIGLIFLGVFAEEQIRYSDYVRTEAFLSEEFTYDNNIPKIQRSYLYSVEGRAYEVPADAVGVVKGSREGITNMRYNPDNPSEVVNESLGQTCFTIGMVVIVGSLPTLGIILYLERLRKSTFHSGVR